MGMPEPSAVPAAATREAAWTRDIAQLSLRDVPIAGGKGANLGELASAGVDVPPGFVITADAYLEALERAGVRSRLLERERAIDQDDPASLAEASDALRGMIGEAGIPRSIAQAIVRAYRKLGPDVKVAVRSSATMEDTAGTSFAGMNEPSPT